MVKIIGTPVSYNPCTLEAKITARTLVGKWVNADIIKSNDGEIKWFVVRYLEFSFLYPVRRCELFHERPIWETQHLNKEWRYITYENLWEGQWSESVT